MMLQVILTIRHLLFSSNIYGEQMNSMFFSYHSLNTHLIMISFKFDRNENGRSFWRRHGREL